MIATVLIVHFVMGIRVPIGWLLVAPAGLVVVNLISIPLTQRRDAISDQELMLALLADVAALTFPLAIKLWVGAISCLSVAVFWRCCDEGLQLPFVWP